MSKNKKNESKGAVATVTAAVVTAMVKTMDGIEAAVESAIAFNYKALVARRNALPRGHKLNVVLHQIVLTLEAEGPDKMAFASAESPKAKQFRTILEGITAKGEDPIFVPLTKAREDAASYQTKKVDVVAERLKKLDEERAKEAAEAAKRTEEKRVKQLAKKQEEEAAAAALSELVSGDVVAEQAGKRDERKAKDEIRRLHLTPIAKVETNVILEEGTRGHVIALYYQTPGAGGDGDGVEQQIELVDWVKLEQRASELFKPLNLGNLTERMTAMGKLTVSCQICTDDMVLGDKQAQIMKVPSWRSDGSSMWVHGRNHRNAGQPVEHRILVCGACAWFARDIAPTHTIQVQGQDRTVKTVRYSPAFKEYEGYCASLTSRHFTGEVDEATGRPMYSQGEAPVLKTRAFSPEDMAAAQAAVGGETTSETGDETEHETE